MTRDDQRNAVSTNAFKVIDGIRSASEVLGELRDQLSRDLESHTDEETRLALYFLDMSMVQLDTLAVHIARKAR